MILAIHTAGATSTLELYSPAANPVATDTWESGRALADTLLERITTLTGSHGGLSAITGIVVFSGPGSFTSLRIGHTVANALAASLNIPVAGGSGDHWQAGAITALAGTSLGRPALPHYGAEANITRPKI